MSAHPPFVFCSIFFFSVPNRTYKPRFFFSLSQLELHVTGNEAPAWPAEQTTDGHLLFRSRGFMRGFAWKGSDYSDGKVHEAIPFVASWRFG